MLESAPWYEKLTPDAYRLLRRKNGELVLQGMYTYTNRKEVKHEWRDIPTVEEQ